MKNGRLCEDFDQQFLKGRPMQCRWRWWMDVQGRSWKPRLVITTKWIAYITLSEAPCSRSTFLPIVSISFTSVDAKCMAYTSQGQMREAIGSRKYVVWESRGNAAQRMAECLQSRTAACSKHNREVRKWLQPRCDSTPDRWESCRRCNVVSCNKAKQKEKWLKGIQWNTVLRRLLVYHF